GIFDEKIKGIIPADSKNLKVAFFNMSPAIKSANDAMNSSVIEIQMLPGGGGPTDNNVNQFEMEYCGGPLDDEGNIDSSEEAPYLSMCDTEKFQASLDAIVEHLITPMQIMTEQLYFNAYQQVFAISTFFDAKEQMDAQRTMQVLATEANRDYQPSEQICRFGSYIKGVAKTEDKKRTTALAFNKIMMDAYTAPQGSAGAKDGEASAFQSRFQQFRTTYCNPADHNAQLSYLCEHDVDLNLDNSNPGADAPGGLGAADSQRMNKDIDFFRTLGKAYTLDIDFNDNQLTDDEEDVIALAKNLYWPNSFGKVENGRILLNKRYQYLDSRSFIALQNIAHNSFANMVSLKAKSIPVLPPQNSNNFQTENVPDGEAVPGWVYMKTMMRDFGLADEDIEKFIGREPSYYAQMDFLTKKLYQQPDFYTNLYDKEANIDRINVVLEAISLMQQRDHYENMLRAEMLSSALLQTDIIPRVELIQGALSGQ
ncbi:MAG: hypothetical protein KTR28_07775, partial [Micavibrio sp.]|nr:hypothetical protein [Micavibrio sp.]